MLETEKFHLIGNNLSLDFVNTKIADGGKVFDLLSDFRDLAAWAIATKMAEESEADSLIVSWTKTGSKSMHKAVKLRTTLHGLFSALIQGDPIRESEIDEINKILAQQSGYSELETSDAGFEKHFRSDFHDPMQLLVSIAASAADLFCYGRLDLIKKCEADNCVLYFYDTTKNHSRRWCSMEHCGNRAKANTFYKRKKERMRLDS